MMAAQMEIDLVTAIQAKNATNRQRPYKYGTPDVDVTQNGIPR
jgi:hypothetical protein